MSSQKEFCVAAVIVTFRRDEQLKRNLESIRCQSFKPQYVIVVDNACSAATKVLVSEFGYQYISGSSQLGGAGGYKLGLESSLKTNAELIWLLDDDGYPAFDCLSNQIEWSIKEELEISAPLCVSQSDHTQSSNPYILGMRKVSNIEFLGKLNVRKNMIQLFNGVLLTRSSIEKIGLPNAELFIRGDELDYFYRIRRARIKCGLVTSARYYHPSSISEYPNSRNSILGVVIPSDQKKKYYQFRNQGYLVRKHMLVTKGLLDWFKYGLYFLFTSKGKARDFKEWAQLWIMGFSLDLKPYNQCSGEEELSS
jgi:rhamnopyranosyl-N-acetylglucosaminyl-diphospho-decaprenol beta-1,3/1,4-galactofuranosyltransferase